MDDSLQQGITALKAGDKNRAFQLLSRATQDKATAEQGWLWLSAAVTHDSERLFCLDNVLRINRGNAAAERGASLLREKGVFPSVPMPPSYTQPRPANPPPAVPAFTDQAAPAAAPLPQVQPQMQPQVQPQAVNADQEGLKGLYQFAAQAMAHKTPPQVIVKNLTDQGLSSETAAAIVSQTQQAYKKGRVEKYKKQMLAGLLWTGAGIVVTVLSIIFADQLGGNSVLCWGAVLFGIIDFLIGLFGWLSSR